MNTHQDISYPAHGNQACAQVEDSSFWFKHRNECISALVGAFVSGSRFADIGGGNGFVARRLQDDGHRVTLIEPGMDGALNASERGVSCVVCSTLGEATGIDHMDAAGAFDVVEHIADDAGFIDQVAGVLSPGGYFFSTVPAHQWLWSGADDEAGHFRRYTARSYAALLAPRFDVRYIGYFFSPLVLPIAVLRAAPYRLGVGMHTTDESASREHGADGGLSSRVMLRLLRPEVARIAALRPSRFGASLIVASQKK
jgi:2-polyprenyl-3-methyl-5-hydroxy-6-metoxy-1,4-benzoquinol methylase